MHVWWLYPLFLSKLLEILFGNIKWHSLEDIFVTLNSVDLFYNENNPRKHLYNISKSLLRKRRIAYHTYVLNADLKELLLRVRTGENIFCEASCGSNHVFIKCAIRIRFFSTPKCASFAVLFIELHCST